jgi:hypothetical protein
MRNQYKILAEKYESVNLIEIASRNKHPDVNLDTTIWGYDPWNMGDNYTFSITIKELLKDLPPDPYYEVGTNILNVLNISEEEFIEKIKRGEVINVTWDDENETQQSYCIDRKKVIKGFTGYGVSDD